MIRIWANRPLPIPTFRQSHLHGRLAPSLPTNQNVTSSPPPHQLYKSAEQRTVTLGLFSSLMALLPQVGYRGSLGCYASGQEPGVLFLATQPLTTLAFPTLALATLPFAVPFTNDLCLHANRLTDL